MQLADIVITTNVQIHDKDLTYAGWIHPQISPDSLVGMVLANYDLTDAPEYSVLVEAETPVGPYTVDCQPKGEFDIATTLDSIAEANVILKEIQEAGEVELDDDIMED